MTIRTRVLKYSLYVEGVKIPAQTIHFNNVSGQGCTMTASIPPHPSCYVFKRGMYVQLFKSVNNGPGVLRFSGILINKVYSKSGDSRELRLECASPEIRLSSMKISERDGSNLSMLSDIHLQGTHMAFDPGKAGGIDYGDTYSLIKVLSDDSEANKHNKELAMMSLENYSGTNINNEKGKISVLSVANSVESGKVSLEDTKKNMDAIKAVNEKFNNYNSAGVSSKFSTAYLCMQGAATSYGTIRDQKAEAQSRLNNLQADLKASNSKDRQAIQSDISKCKSEIKGYDKSMEEQAKIFKESAGITAKESGQSNIGNMTVENFLDYDNAMLLTNEIKATNEAFKTFGNGLPDAGTTGSVAMTEGVNVSNAYVQDLLFDDKSHQVSDIKTPSDNGEIDKGQDDGYDHVNRPSFAKLYNQYAQQNGNDYFKAFVDLILYFYSLVEDHRIRYEADYFGILSLGGQKGDCFYSLGIIDGSSFKASESGTMTNPSTGTNYTPISKLLADIINKTVHSSEAGTPVMNVIQQVLSTMMAKFSVVHTQFNRSIVIHPIMCNYFPPCRNVIFPGMASSIQYNPNDWANPTRTYMMYQSYLRPNAIITMFTGQRVMPQVLAVAPKEARALKSMNYQVMQNAKAATEMSNKIDTASGSGVKPTEYLKKNIDGFKATNMYVTDEEEEIGRATNFISFGLGEMIRAPSISQSMMADMLHGMAKYGCRTCVVTGGDELDDIVVGMPIVVLDHVYSIYGTVESVSFTAIGEGNVQSSVSISMPRMPMLNPYDVLTHAGLWFDTPRSSPSQIGKYYGELLGDSAENQSFFNKCKNMADGKYVNSGLMVDKDGLDDDTVLLKMCIASLNNAYINSKDKEEFVKKFRSVTEETDAIGGENGKYNEAWISKKGGGSGSRSSEVKKYLESLELTKENSQINKYARVTPDSLSYDKMGFISINLKASKWTESQGYVDSLNTKPITDTYSTFSRASTKSPEEIKEIQAGMNGLQEGSLDSPIVGGYETSPFGIRTHPITKKEGSFHRGLDIGYNRVENTPIYSVANGRVVDVGYHSQLGNYVKVDNGNDFKTLVGHCANGSIRVKPGDYVRAGEQLAGMGKTGSATQCHTHFVVYYKNNEVDPRKYFKSDQLPPKGK